ncbi:Zn-ribbon domain-containing OB-fold protein [Aquabacterium sp.]|uniref:Zn-ribbon domain-containing OB-fold protein n=1 Tax=Aquabacterium sp. TaxID=1872578 RepID=UPI002BE62E7E|nr:OB-fold domain-containing protein [Aquabacterium sp.]HSW06034.1 OB-fold domain-containing protein [Aquabacterium sp.]
MTNDIPLHDGLFTWPSATPQLIGGRCTDCGSFHFPPQDNCPHCAGLAVERQPLSRRGTLWTWTVQGFVPPVPPYAGAVEGFVPFGVGYVELPEGLCVQGRLTVNDPAQLRIGMTMELTTETLHTDADGAHIVSYAFRPVAA